MTNHVTKTVKIKMFPGIRSERLCLVYESVLTKNLITNILMVSDENTRHYITKY